MTQYRIEYTKPALNDLRDVYEYIAFSLIEPSIAEKQTERIMSAIHNLNHLPKRFRLYDSEPWRSRGFRVMPVNNYTVFYILEEEKSLVTIMRIIYGGRDIDNALNESEDTTVE
jgi:toxin ParE1/3/4